MNSKRGSLRLWLWVIISLVAIIIIGIVFSLFLVPRGSVVLEGNYLREFVFSKNSDFVVFSEGGATTCRGGECTHIPVVWKISDTKFNEVNTLPHTDDLLRNYRIFSPNGNKILYPGERYDERYPGATPNRPNIAEDAYYYAYHDLYVYNVNTKESKKVTNNIEDLMYSAWTDFYVWKDENNIIYTCRPGGEEEPLPENFRNNEDNLSTYCTMNLITNEVTSKVGPPANFYDGETNVYEGEKGSLRHSLVRIYKIKDNCLPNFNKNLCVFEKTNSFGESLISYKLYVRQNGKDDLVYKGTSRPEAIYWSKDDKIYLVYRDKVVEANPK